MEAVIVRLRESFDAVARELEEGPTAVPSTPAGWTVEEILEHLILVERGVLVLLRRAMSAPATERTEVWTDDEVWETSALTKT